MINVKEVVSVLGVGDIILDVPENDSFFNETRNLLRQSDVAVGHVEVPHTKYPSLSTFSPSPAAAADPENLAALANAGFNIATTAGNHTFDQGVNGVMDTLETLHKYGIITAGTGINLEEARKPARIERKGLRFAVFQYNCNGPVESWASPMKAGGAFIRVSTSYEFNGHEPGSLPTEIYTVADPKNLDEMRKDFQRIKDECDVIIAAFHLGRMVFPELLQCQTQITHYAIDCGAQMVMCHHPHTLQGVELYKGCPIFYSLGNFVIQTQSLFKNDDYIKLHNYKPFNWPGITPVTQKFSVTNSVISNYPFDDVSRNTMIAKCLFTKDGLVQAGFIPCYIDDLGHPVPLTRESGGQKVLEHVMNLNEIELLETRLEWNDAGDEVLILDDSM